MPETSTASKTSELRFSKMRGCGNDFVVVDAVRQKLPKHFPAAFIADRRMGVGCDQILILQKPPAKSNADFGYRIINADGSEVGQCGNGARCVHAFLRREKLSRKKRLTLQTSSASVMTEDAGDGMVRAYLATPEFDPVRIPLRRGKRQDWYSASAAEGGGCLPGKFAALSLGNPHAVFITEQEDPQIAGEFLNRRRRLFPEGVNVGFCQVSKRGVQLRVYERGAGETPSCGSGAVAAAVVLLRQPGVRKRQIRVAMPGGELQCGWDGDTAPAWLQGPLHFVFDGKIKL